MSNILLTELFGLPVPFKESPVLAADHPLEITRFRAFAGFGVSVKISHPGTQPDEDHYVAVNFSIRIHSYKLLWKDLVALARGDTIHREDPGCPDSHEKASGNIRLHWWLDNNLTGQVLPWPCYEFIPKAPLPAEISFEDWREIRFPRTSSSREHQHIWYHSKWREETKAPLCYISSLDLLGDAVCKNEAERVDYMLSLGLSGNQLTGSWDGSLLAIAMENTGKLECGFEQYRERMNPIAAELDEPDWVPRADRIVVALKAAGALDYLPLPIAAMAGDISEVKRLLEKGYPVDFSSYSYPPALYSAVKQENLEMVRLILEAGADPNSKWDSILLKAIAQRNPYDEVLPEILNLLMKAGASLMNSTVGERSSGSFGEMSTEQNPDIFSLYAYCGRESIDERIAEILFGGEQKFEKVRDLNGATLLGSWRSDELIACKRWIPKDVINEHDLNFETPLFSALLKNNDEGNRMIDFLLSAGADPDIPCIAALAMLDGSLSTFDEKHLAELMQDPHTDAAESIGWKSFAMLTPLQAAAIMGRFDLVWKFRQTSKTPTHSVPIFRRPEEILARHHRRIRSDITRWPVLDHALDSNPYYFGLEITESGFHGLAPQEYYRFIHRLLNSPETRNNYPEFCNEHVLFDDSKLYPREGLLCWSLLKYPISVRPGLKCSRTHSSQSKSALFR